MKSKPVKIALLIGVLAIWGLIGYQLLAPASMENEGPGFSLATPAQNRFRKPVMWLS